MSFLIEATTRRVATALPRASIAAHAPRAFSTSIVHQKSATETVKDGLKSVDRAVSDKLVDGLDVAESAKNKAQAAAEAVKHSSAKGKAEELKGQAKGAAAEAEGKAKGAAEELKKKMKDHDISLASCARNQHKARRYPKGEEQPNGQAAGCHVGARYNIGLENRE
ncbi:hypothetical protein K4F52_003571 [Lecanicillium sp. MT-2017a]|nr:hypothetical protein K4F52_003571 [Lecanicillium sp. MT-2017a]